MADMIEEAVAKTDTTKDLNEGKSMLDFVKSEVKIEASKDKVEDEESLAQKPGTTEEVAVEDGELEADPKEKTEGEEEQTEKKPKEGEEEKGDEDAEPEDKKEEEQKGPVPYERFEEVNNKYKVTVEEYERVKPLAESRVQIQQYCERNGITTEQFRTLLDIQATINSNPEEGLKKLLPVIEQLQGFTGDKLPADLQKEVDGNQLSLERARELAKLRAQNQLGGQRFQQFQQLQAQRAQTEFQRQQVGAINSWVQAKTKIDPDFKPRADENAPRGRFEFVYDAMQSMLAERDAQGQLRHVIKSPDDVPKMLEKAYQEVVKGLAPLTKRPATRRALTQNGSTGRNTEVKIENAKSMKEAIQIAAAAHGL